MMSVIPRAPFASYAAPQPPAAGSSSFQLHPVLGHQRRILGREVGVDADPRVARAGDIHRRRHPRPELALGGGAAERLAGPVLRRPLDAADGGGDALRGFGRERDHARGS